MRSCSYVLSCLLQKYIMLGHQECIKTCGVTAHLGYAAGEIPALCLKLVRPRYLALDN